MEDILLKPVLNSVLYSMLGFFILLICYYILEKLTSEGKCVAIRFDLKYIPGHIPGSFTIEAEVSRLRIHTACRLVRVSR